VLSGTYQCTFDNVGDLVFLTSTTWTLATVWEVLALCLAVWIAVKHFRELRRHSTSGIIGDCFTVLMQTHVSYFAR
jgi:preprotein translocase subunit SecG